MGLGLVAATVIVGWAVVANRPSLDDVPPAGGATDMPVEGQAPPPGVTAPAPPPAIAAEPGAGTAQPEPGAESATQEVGASGGPEVTEIRALPQIDELLAQAQAAFERGDLEAARSRYEDVLDIDPGHGAAAEGVRVVTTAEEIASGSRQRRIDELLETALAAFDRGDVAAARNAYEEVLALDPAHAGASEGLEAVATAEEIIGRRNPQD